MRLPVVRSRDEELLGIRVALTTKCMSETDLMSKSQGGILRWADEPFYPVLQPDIKSRRKGTNAAHRKRIASFKFNGGLADWRIRSKSFRSLDDNLIAAYTKVH